MDGPWQPARTWTLLRLGLAFLELGQQEATRRCRGAAQEGLAYGHSLSTVEMGRRTLKEETWLLSDP